MGSDKVKHSFVLYTSQMKILQKLDMRQRGELLTALMNYVSGEEPPALDEKTDVAFSAIQIQIDMDKAKYEQTIEKRTAAGRASAAARKARKEAEKSTYVDFVEHNVDVDVDEDVDVDVDVDVPTANPAGAPTVEEVKAYADSIGYTSLDAQSFCDYYSARGWKINGEPIRDWKALVRRWKRQDDKPGAKKNGFHNFDERKEDLDADTAERMRKQHDEYLRRQQSEA